MARGVAELLFLQYQDRGFARFQEALSQSEGEFDNSDFKEFDASSYRNVLGKIMSGFANNDGGVIVWGIEAKQGKPPEDKPITDLAAARQLIDDAYSQVLDPLLPGTQTLSIELPTDPTRGYLVTFVPESRGRPHRSCAKGDHRYYIRIGANTEILPHRLLADLLLARARPELRANFAATWIEPGMSINLQITLSNTGAVAAHGAALAIADNARWLNCNPGDLSVEIDFDGETRAAHLCQLSRERVIFPGMTVFAASINVEFRGRGAGSLQEYRARIRLYADDFMGVQELTGPELDIPPPSPLR